MGNDVLTRERGIRGRVAERSHDGSVRLDWTDTLGGCGKQTGVRVSS